MAGYAEFASVYDLLTANVPYDEIAAYYNNILKDLGAGKLLLDLGCGTGNLTVRMSEIGYDVIGADASEEMLSIAAAKSSDVQWICQSMTETDLYGAADAAISTLDSINHLESAEDIQRCFDRLAKNLTDGGVFVFDVNTIYKHREVLADNTFIYDVDGVYCAWTNAFCPEDNGVDIDLDLFFENEDGTYTRGGEYFREIAFSRSDIERMLEKAGFVMERMYDYLSFDPPTEKSEKLLFAARKK